MVFPLFNQELFEPDLDHLEVDLERVIGHVPESGEAGIKDVINGPICYTPDALPLPGPLESHADYGSPLVFVSVSAPALVLKILVSVPMADPSDSAPGHHLGPINSKFGLDYLSPCFLSRHLRLLGAREVY